MAVQDHKFWAAFTSAIGLPKEFIDDKKDPRATRNAVAKIIASRSAEDWRPVFAKADCCVTIVAPLADAVRDPHFVDRGLFAHELEAQSGATMPALPVPIDPVFRAPPGKKRAPKLD